MGWTCSDIKKLLENIKKTLPRTDQFKYSTTIDLMDWNRIKFGDFTKEECQAKFTELLENIRCYRTLSETLNDAEQMLLSQNYNDKEVTVEPSESITKQQLLETIKRKGVLVVPPTSERENKMLRFEEAHATRKSKRILSRNRNSMSNQPRKVLSQPKRKPSMRKTKTLSGVVKKALPKEKKRRQKLPPKLEKLKLKGRDHWGLVLYAHENLHALLNTKPEEKMQVIKTLWQSLDQMDREIYIRRSSSANYQIRMYRQTKLEKRMNATF